MLSHGARGNSGEKFHPCSARGEESLRRRKLFAGPDLVADFPVIASSSKALVIVSQNEQPIVERSYLTVVVLRRRSMKCSSNGSFYARLIFFFFFFLFLNKHASNMYCTLENNKFFKYTFEIRTIDFD